MSDAGAPAAVAADVVSPPTAGTGIRPEGTVKLEPAHFQVREIPARAPDGDGAHLWLEIERSGMNTEYAARLLARLAGAAPRDVGYAGLKDRHARTRQWFSVPFDADVDALVGVLHEQGLQVLVSARSARKLRRGALAGNRFRIVVTHVGDPPGRGGPQVACSLEAGCDRIRREGVPNYFGPQRFGHGGQNVERARQMLCDGVRVRDRHLRGLYLSAARSALFNRVLAARVVAGHWNTLLPGEAVALDGSSSFFCTDAVDEELAHRLAAFDVHPSGPLWGRDPSPARGEAGAVEAAALRGNEALMDGLAAAALDHARRALRIAVPDLVASPADTAGAWCLEFTLPPGAYATVVLRELFRLRDAGGG